MGLWEMTVTISPSPALFSPSVRSSSQMNLLFNIPSNKISTLACFNHRFRKSLGTTAAAASFRSSIPKRVPGRDRIIDFGKYKGRMLGSVPSKYLKWISKNLRAGDTLEWAKLADEVLSDPVYRDRIEWEFAEKILTGDSASAYRSAHGNAVSALLEVSERFEWDYEDKIGWSKIDFAILGTSNGGRIPRLGAKRSVEIGNLKKKKDTVEGVEEDGDRRRERRERVRQRRLKSRMGRVGGDGRSEEMKDEEEEEEDGAVNGDPIGGRSPFPGREALLNKVLNRRML